MEDEVRVGVLVRTIEHEIIPRLMLAHKADPQCLEIPEGMGGLTAADAEMFVKLILSPDTQLASICVAAMRQRGVPAEDVCLGLLAPVARRLGELWQQDLCDFSDVTLGLGRLQRILREIGPGFDQGPDAAANGWRVLLLPAPGEQHTFGLLMVGEFFRHAGWEVELALGIDGLDPVRAVREGWFDLVGFSVGVDAHVHELGLRIDDIRNASSNPQVCIMLGGSLLMNRPGLADMVGADMVAGDGRMAPVIAEGHLAPRVGRRTRS